jgi:hypothetical protein
MEREGDVWEAVDVTQKSCTLEITRNFNELNKNGDQSKFPHKKTKPKNL